jgi:O-antigen/teichoic acid export membrane protein
MSLPRAWARLRSNGSARAVSILFSAEAASFVTLTAQALIIARYLGPATFGRLAVVLGLATLVASLLDLRSGDAVTRFLPRHMVSGRVDQAAKLAATCLTADAMVLAFSSVLVVAVSVTVPSLAPLPLPAVLLALVGALVLLPTTTARAILNVLGRHGTVAGLQIAGTMIRLLALLAVVAADAGLAGVLIVVNLGLALEAVVTLLVANHRLTARSGVSALRLADPRGVPGDVRRFMGWNGAVTLSGALVKSGDVVLVGAVAGPTAAGFYRLAKSLATPIGMLALPMQTIFYNRLSAARSRGPVAWRTTLIRAQLAALPVALAIALATPVVPAIVRLLAGEDYAPAGTPAAWLVLGGAIGLLGYWGRPVLLVLDYLRPSLYAALLVTALFAAVAVPAADAAGATGAALARLAVVSVLGNAILLFLVWRALRRHSPGTATVPPGTMRPASVGPRTTAYADHDEAT